MPGFDPYKIVITESAINDIRQFNRVTRSQIHRGILRLGKGPLVEGEHIHQTPDIYAAEFGGARVLYVVSNPRRIVTVVRVRRRDTDAFRGLLKRFGF